MATKGGWWYKPDFIINQLNINSAISTPAHDQTLAIPPPPPSRIQGLPATEEEALANTFEVKGYAYNGGGRKIIRIEVTLDNGRTWQDCEIIRHEKPTEYGKYWSWIFWRISLPVTDLVLCRDIAVRAWDSSMNTQPQQLTWNVMGMMNNCWFRVLVHKKRSSDGSVTALTFEHPTRPGNLQGGWMTRPAVESDEDEGVPAGSLARPQTQAAKQPQAATSSEQPAASSGRKFTMAEVSEHSNESSAWIVVHGKVYDCTPFLKAHPGGAQSILICAGQDATEEFDAIHSSKAKDMLREYYIGDLAPTDDVAEAEASTANSIRQASSSSASVSSQLPAHPIALNPKQRQPFKLIQKDILSHDTRRFRFALQSPEHRLGLPVGKHLLLSATIKGKLVMRAYTPTSSDEECGYFDLVVKIYFAGVVPACIKGGLMSQHLDSLSIGDTVEARGPLGHIAYEGRGRFVVDGKVRQVKRLAMLGGGTGITPLFQVLQAIMRDAKDKTEVSLIYANRTPADILLRQELEAWAAERPTSVRIWFTVSNSAGEPGWPYSTGHIDGDMVKKHLPEWDDDTLALLCGPPPMLEFACLPNLKLLGYGEESCLCF